MSKILATIILVTNKPQNAYEFITNLESKTIDPSQIEIIFSIDTGDQACITTIEELKATSKFHIKYLEGTRTRGYFEANHHCNNCLALADPDSYFFAAFSDKVKIKEKGWDEVLKKYVHHFEDDYFRIRISGFKNVRYTGNLKTAIMKPENFAFHTRKFLEITGGWGDNWGPDSWAQALVFFNELLGIDDRDIVESNINMEEYIYTSPKNPAINFLRCEMINWSFVFMSNSKIALMNYFRIALKSALYLKNYKSPFIKNQNFRFLYSSDGVSLIDDLGITIDKICYNDAANNLTNLNYGCNAFFITNNILNTNYTQEMLLYNKINKRFANAKKGGIFKKFLVRINIMKTIMQILTLSIQDRKTLYTKNTAIFDEDIIKRNIGTFEVETNKQIEIAIREKYYFAMKAASNINSNA